MLSLHLYFSIITWLILLTQLDELWQCYNKRSTTVMSGDDGRGLTQPPTLRWSTLGVTRCGAAPLPLASCCGGCWVGGCAAPAVSAAWPDWRLPRSAQTPGRSPLRVEREGGRGRGGRRDGGDQATVSFWRPQLFSLARQSSIHLARLSTVAEKSQWAPTAFKKSLLHCKNSEWKKAKFSRSRQLAATPVMTIWGENNLQVAGRVFKVGKWMFCFLSEHGAVEEKAAREEKISLLLNNSKNVFG